MLTYYIARPNNSHRLFTNFSHIALLLANQVPDSAPILTASLPGPHPTFARYYRAIVGQ